MKILRIETCTFDLEKAAVFINISKTKLLNTNLNYNFIMSASCASTKYKYVRKPVFIDYEVGLLSYNEQKKKKYAFLSWYDFPAPGKLKIEGRPNYKKYPSLNDLRSELMVYIEKNFPKIKHPYNVKDFDTNEIIKWTECRKVNISRQLKLNKPWSKSVKEIKTNKIKKYLEENLKFDKVGKKINYNY